MRSVVCKDQRKGSENQEGITELGAVLLCAYGSRAKRVTTLRMTATAIIDISVVAPSNREKAVYQADGVHVHVCNGNSAAKQSQSQLAIRSALLAKAYYALLAE